MENQKEFEKNQKKEKVYAGWKNYVPIGLTAFLVLASAIVFCFIMFRIELIVDAVKMIIGILQPILIGLALAYLLVPIVHKFENLLLKVFKRTKNDEQYLKGYVIYKPARAIAIVITMLILIVFVYVLGAMVLPELVRSVSGLIAALPGQINTLINELSALVEKHPQLSGLFKDGENIVTISEFFKNWLQSDFLPTVLNLAVGIKGFVSVLINIVIGLVVSIYVLYAKERFVGQAKKCIFVFIPKPQKAQKIIETTRMCNRTFGGFLSGMIIKSVIVAILCFLGMSIFHMPYNVLVSVIVGVTNIIPFFGPYIGAVFSGALILLQDPMMCLYFIIFIIVLQQIDGNIIGPKVLGDSTGLSAFWVMFSILLGGGLFGVIGMILGVPCFAVIYQLFSEFINNRLRRKGLPTDTNVVANIDLVKADGTVLSFEETTAEKKERSDLRRKKKNRFAYQKKSALSEDEAASDPENVYAEPASNTQKEK